MPLISIIIPVYNAEKYLNRCLDSILRQDASKFEVLLVNDGSADNSSTICDTYANTNSNVKVYHKENGGPSSARNMGLTKARGTYIAFVDSDDYVMEDFIEILSSHIKETNPDIIFFAYNHLKNDKIFKINNELNKSLDHKKILELLANTSANNFLWYPWNKLYKKSLIDKNNITFDLKIKVGEDTLFNMRCYYYANNVLNINNPLYNYVSNENSITQTPYKAYFNKNIAEHFENRIQFHQENSPINNIKYYKDIARYYIEHSFFLLLANAINKPEGIITRELNDLRQMELFKFLFKYYKPSNRITIKMKILIYLFKYKQFSLMSKLL